MPILLRSGDVVIMSKDARLAYHGVPRILPPSSEGDRVPVCLRPEAITHSPQCNGWSLEDQGEGSGDEGSKGVAGNCESCHALLSVWTDVMAYLSMSRINVNVRQVVSDKHQF